MPEWTFLTNHALVLSFITRKPNITARELYIVIGITERSVRRIIADLYNAGYINKEKEGRRMRYHINPDLPLCHDTQRDIPVGDFLETLG